MVLALLLAAPAMAQDSTPETIEVSGTQILAGFWQIHFPAGISFSVPMILRTLRGTFAGQEAFFRLEPGQGDLSVRCLPWNGSGTATLEDTGLHLAWGVAVFRFVIDAPLINANAFTGVYKLKAFGLDHEAPAPAFGRKLVLADDVPDTAGQAKALQAVLAELATGTSALPQDHAARIKFGGSFGGPPPMTAAEFRVLGAQQQVTYLGTGRAPVPGPRGTGKDATTPPEYMTFSVYGVEFVGGQRLCGVHADASGKMDQMLCV